jgi:benzoate-CoA ligase
MSHTETAAPPERFNFARHLIALNAGRPGKAALIDDAGTLTYGQLAEQVSAFRPRCRRWG